MARPKKEEDEDDRGLELELIGLRSLVERRLRSDDACGVLLYDSDTEMLLFLKGAIIRLLQDSRRVHWRFEGSHRDDFAKRQCTIL